MLFSHFISSHIKTFFTSHLQYYKNRYKFEDDIFFNKVDQIR